MGVGFGGVLFARAGDRAAKIMYSHFMDVRQNILARTFPASDLDGLAGAQTGTSSPGVRPEGADETAVQAVNQAVKKLRASSSWTTWQ